MTTYEIKIKVPNKNWDEIPAYEFHGSAIAPFCAYIADQLEVEVRWNENGSCQGHYVLPAQHNDVPFTVRVVVDSENLFVEEYSMKTLVEYMKTRFDDDPEEKAMTIYKIIKTGRMYFFSNSECFLPINQINVYIDAFGLEYDSGVEK